MKSANIVKQLQAANIEFLKVTEAEGETLGQIELRYGYAIRFPAVGFWMEVTHAPHGRSIAGKIKAYPVLIRFLEQIKPRSPENMQTNNPIAQRMIWAAAANRLLVGRTVKEVRYLSGGDLEALGWRRASLAIVFDDGTAIYASADDEGNDAGALFTTCETLPVLPTI